MAKCEMCENIEPCRFCGYTPENVMTAAPTEGAVKNEVETATELELALLEKIKQMQEREEVVEVVMYVRAFHKERYIDFATGEMIRFVKLRLIHNGLGENPSYSSLILMKGFDNDIDFEAEPTFRNPVFSETNDGREYPGILEMQKVKVKVKVKVERIEIPVDGVNYYTDGFNPYQVMGKD